MENTLPLLKGRIKLEDALGEDKDVTQELAYPEKRALFYLYLNRRRSEIASVVSRHLNLPSDSFHLGEIKEWIHGSFNVCIPIHVNPRRRDLPARAIIRFPLPYKTGEEHFPGNSDEKLRCEVATYVWLQRHCPDVPIPRLYGFGFPGRPSFTAIENEPFYNRVRWFFRSVLTRLSGKTLPPYFAHSRQGLLEVGYLVIEHVAEGEMLSCSWKEHQADERRRANLFRDLSRIMLSLARLPQPRIGSWTMDDRGFIALANRPLTFTLHKLESQDIPTGIPRGLTYASTDTYLSDLLACHDQRIRRQPNSIHTPRDGEDQLAALTMMRALLPRFANRRLREGPFVMTLTDLHQSNIFVDDDWNVTRLIDLEWACARPAEMAFRPPWWLSSPSAGPSALGIDELTDEEHDRYAARHAEFAAAFEAVEEETLASAAAPTPVAFGTGSGSRTGTGTGSGREQQLHAAAVLRENWASGAFWYAHALDSPSALYAIFLFHVQPRFAELTTAELDEFSRFVAPYWDRDTRGFIEEKVRQQGEYERRLRGLFAAAAQEEKLGGP